MSRLFSKIVVVAAGASALLLGGCEVGPKQTQQTGYRGAGLDQIVDVAHIKKVSAIPPLPIRCRPMAARRRDKAIRI